jgi:hypothetical protein
MMANFNDIRIVGLDEERTTRADPLQPFYDVHFVLSADAPAAWGWIAQEQVSRKGIVGRKAWPQSKHIVVRCRIEEVERAFTVLRPILERVNREYRAWAAAAERTRLEQEAFDRQELQKLRDVKARLGLN